MIRKSFVFTFLTLTISVMAQTDQNPLLGEFDTPHGIPPFDKIRTEHYLPAFTRAIAMARAEVDAIRDNPEAPDFDNTVAALDFSGKKLSDVAAVFFNLNEAETGDAMQKIALEISPVLTDFYNDIQLDPALFKRVESVYRSRDGLHLSPEQNRLLEKTYKGFVRSGAGLDPEAQERYRAVTSELSDLTLKFGQNVLAATNAFILHLTDPADLAGLPGMIREAAAEEARSRGLEGWVVTLQAPSMVPFVQYSEKRELREKVWRAYNNRCLGGEYDNTGTIARIVNLRLELANLLGYPTYADYILEERMAGSRAAVNEFLDELVDRAMPYARQDYETIGLYADSNGLEGTLMPWDWSFYTEKYKAEHYSINDELLRPYFKLENVQKGMFLLANKLYGLKFRETNDLPVYHPDVKTFEVYDGDGSFLSVLYIDYFPRPTKRGGAWMTSFRDQYIENGKNVRPVVSLVCNFTKPTADTPSLLTFGEAETILHEFGHALHGMLSEGTYPGLTGTSVYRDFVELPSQLMENWMTEKEYLDLWAVHYETGETIPQEMIDKIVAARNYLSGYLNSRQLGFGLTDMAWHTLEEPFTGSVVDFENRAVKRTRVLPEVEGAAMSPSFSHIFAGGYAAGYYGYKWAEVLDADAFALFREQGIFDGEVAGSFRENILSRGGSEPPMELYIRFRGKEPTTEAFFERAGLK